VIPTKLRESLDLLDPRLRHVEAYLTSRLTAELSSVKVVTIEPRVKGSESIYQKLQLGKYAAITKLHDLVGFKVVLLRRSMLREALDALEGSNLTVVETNLDSTPDPRSFSYHQPHVIVELPADYSERNPEVAGLRAEIQITTALQHALDMATHDFDYKGKSFAWADARIVAQLRGSLELIDNILDDIEASAKLGKYKVPTPLDLQRLQNVLDVLKTHVSKDGLPEDQRRMSQTVAAMLEAVEVSTHEFDEMCSRHSDVIGALTLSPSDAALGVLVREKGDAIVASYPGYFCVPDELLSLCPETEVIPLERRVSLEFPAAPEPSENP
jgi:ppGpp synthetase/RelA/SpoT-type nucleotidyltranferase